MPEEQEGDRVQGVGSSEEITEEKVESKQSLRSEDLKKAEKTKKGKLAPKP